MTEAAPRGSAFWPLHATVWGAFSVTAIVAALPYDPPTLFWLQSLIIGALGAMISAGFRPVYDRTVRRDITAVAKIMTVAGAALLAGTIWTVVHNTLPIFLFGSLGVEVRPIGGWTRVLRGNVLDCGIMLAWGLGYVALRTGEATRDANERALRADLAHREARLIALRHQLNPHFLLNALNALSTLVMQNRTSEACRMIAELGGFLRGILGDQNSGTVTIAGEMDLLRRYLAIERIRYGEQLIVTTDVDDAVRGALVPALLLQPLVENAVRHAVAASPRPVTISIAISRQADHVSIALSNPFVPGASGDAAPGMGIGLRNTRERIEALVGGDGLVQLTTAEGVATVTMTLPYITDETRVREPR